MILTYYAARSDGCVEKCYNVMMIDPTYDQSCGSDDVQSCRFASDIFSSTGELRQPNGVRPSSLLSLWLLLSSTIFKDLL